MKLNTTVLKQPLRKTKVEEGVNKFKLLEITPRYGVKWYENKNANVVDLKLESESGEVIWQRELYSFSFSSNLGKLIRALLSKSSKEFIYKIDVDEIIGKEVIGEVVYWKSPRGDIFEKVKNFKSIEDYHLDDNEAI